MNKQKENEKFVGCVACKYQDKCNSNQFGQGCEKKEGVVMKLIDKETVLSKIEMLKGKIDFHDDYANGWHNALTSVETEIDFLDTKDKNLKGTEIIHESISKALDDYKVSSELFDVATEYIRNTLPRFDKKFPVKSNEISAAIFFGANWERQRILDKVCWWLNNNRLGVIDDDYINKLRKEMED